jgi:two-component sensor histidine kinase
LRSAQRETGDPQAQILLSEAAQRVGAMATAQQVLYDSSSAVSFEIEDFMQALVNTAHAMYPHEARVTRDTALGVLPNDSAMPVALILNELMTNAIKYGRKDGQPVDIHIALEWDNGNWLLSLNDNGPGFDPGKTTRRGSGLGLVRGLAAQLGGSFHVERDNGARCIVEFPASLTRQ